MTPAPHPMLNIKMVVLHRGNEEKHEHRANFSNATLFGVRGFMQKMLHIEGKQHMRNGDLACNIGWGTGEKMINLFVA